MTDIYRAVRISTDLSEFVTCVEKEQLEHFYQPTRDKLSSIGKSCSVVAQHVSGLLGEDYGNQVKPFPDVTDCVYELHRVHNTVNLITQNPSDTPSSIMRNLEILYQTSKEITSTLADFLGISNESQPNTIEDSISKVANATVDNLKLSTDNNSVESICALFDQLKGAIVSALAPGASKADNPSELSSKSTYEPVDTKSGDDETYVSNNADPPPVPKKPTPIFRGRMLSRYIQAFDSVQNSNTQFHEAKDLSKLIINWIRKRFLGGDPDFRYNLSHFPQWVEAIVCGYSQAIDKNRVIDFTEDFTKWLDSLEDVTIPYALPKNLFKILKSSGSSHINMTSMVL